jgi:hypothetical protein
MIRDELGGRKVFESQDSTNQGLMKRQSTEMYSNRIARSCRALARQKEDGLECRLVTGSRGHHRLFGLRLRG